MAGFILKWRSRIDNIAASYMFGDDFRSALKNYRKALSIRKKACGKNSLEVAMSYNNIAEMYRWFDDDYAKAVKYYSRALDVIRAVCGESGPEVATGYMNLGIAYTNLRDSVKAENSLRKALAASKSYYGENHPMCADVYLSIADYYSLYENYIEGLENYQAAYEIVSRMRDGHWWWNSCSGVLYMAYMDAFTLTDEPEADYKDFMSERVFTLTVQKNLNPMTALGMQGKYYLLAFADWTPDSHEALNGKINELKDKSKNILVMKDGEIQEYRIGPGYNFDNDQGALFDVEFVGKEEKEAITDAYNDWLER